MNRISVLTTALFLILLTPLYAQEEARIGVDREDHDFGRVIDGKKAETTFELRNEGSLDLVIEKVSASCGCTVPVPDPETIPAGENGVLRIEFDSTGRAGPWRGSVVVHTNDPETPRLVVRLQAEVVPEVRLSTSYVYFGEVFRGEEQVREVVLENITFEGLELEDHILEGDAFRVEMVDEGGADPGGRFVFRVALQPDAPFGYVEGNLYLRTNFEKNPLLRVFLISRVKGYVELSKPRIDFGILLRSEESTGRSEEITVFSHREPRPGSGRALRKGPGTTRSAGPETRPRPRPSTSADLVNLIGARSGHLVERIVKRPIAPATT